MAEVVVFHHALGLTPGVMGFAERLRRAGHTVHVPDLYEGRVFETLEAGIDYAQAVGMEEIVMRGVRAAEALAEDIVYIGFSLGVLPAQRLAQTRVGARGALLLHACVPVTAFGDAWPEGVPVQVHAMEEDPWFIGDGDIEAARALVERAEGAELVLYPGKGHLFAEPGVDFDAEAAEELGRRVGDFLAGLERG